MAAAYVEEDGYHCEACDSQYDEEEDAELCCAYECPECGEFYSEDYAALECCDEFAPRNNYNGN